MGILIRLFGSGETIANGLVKDDDELRRHWEAYIASYPRKRERLANIEKTRDHAGLQREIKTELVDIGDDEHEEREILGYLDTVSNLHEIQVVHRIEECLGHVATRHHYVYRLLEELHNVLHTELHLAKLLVRGAEDVAAVIDHLRKQVEIEDVILKKIGQINTFHEILLALAKGEHIIRRLDRKERYLYSLIERRLERAYAGEMTGSQFHLWEDRVVEGLKEAITAAVADGRIEGSYWADLAFVNHDGFYAYARDVGERVRRELQGEMPRDKPISDRLLAAFVQLFRDAYNKVQ